MLDLKAQLRCELGKPTNYEEEVMDAIEAAMCIVLRAMLNICHEKPEIAAQEIRELLGEE